jgi:hypothetical protein
MKVVTGIALAVLLTSSAYAENIVILPVTPNANPVIDARWFDPTPLVVAAMDELCSDPASLAVTTGACSWMTEDHSAPTVAVKPGGIGSDYVASPPVELPAVVTPLPRPNPLKANAKATPKRQHANPSIN